VDGLGRRLDVDPRVAQQQAETGASVDRVGPQGPAQLGQQRVERTVGRRRRLGPQRFAQFVAADEAMTVDGQVGEEQPTLTTREAGLQPFLAALDDERSAQLHPHRG